MTRDKPSILWLSARGPKPGFFSNSLLSQAVEDCDHLLVELRDVGYVEVSGLEEAGEAARTLHQRLGSENVWRVLGVWGEGGVGGFF